MVRFLKMVSYQNLSLFKISDDIKFCFYKLFLQMCLDRPFQIRNFTALAPQIKTHWPRENVLQDCPMSNFAAFYKNTVSFNVILLNIQFVAYKTVLFRNCAFTPQYDNILFDKLLSRNDFVF